jgi:hypothetical protein
MSEYTFACPNCSQTISSADDQAGRTVQCPTCKHQFTAPKPVVTARPPPLPAQLWAGGSSPAPPPIPSSAGVAPPLIASAGTATPPIAATTELERQVLEGGRFVVFQYCFSVLILTFRRSSPVMFLRSGEDGASSALSYSLISLFAGWWGIPWGPIWTISSLITNARGGKDLTQAVLTQQLGPARAAQIMAQRRPPAPHGGGLKALRWGLAGAAALLVLAVMALVFGPVVGALHQSRRARQPGEAQFNVANHQIEMYRGNAAYGNSPKALAVATRFSSNMKSLRAALFDAGKPSGFSVSHHEFLTCCELQATQCVLIVHVPELRRFSASAKDSLGTLAWLTAQQALQTEQAGKPGMGVAVGLRGVTLYDRVLIGTYAPDSSSTTNGPSETITGPHPEKTLFPWFQSAETQASAP